MISEQAKQYLSIETSKAIHAFSLLFDHHRQIRHTVSEHHPEETDLIGAFFSAEQSLAKAYSEFQRLHIALTGFDVKPS